MCVCVGDDDEGKVFGLQCLGLFCVSVSTPQGGGRENISLWTDRGGERERERDIGVFRRERRREIERQSEMQGGSESERGRDG